MSKDRRNPRSHVPPPGGAMRAKQDKRRMTRSARQQEWLAEWEDEAEDALVELQGISDEGEGC